MKINVTSDGHDLGEIAVTMARNRRGRVIYGAAARLFIKREASGEARQKPAAQAGLLGVHFKKSTGYLLLRLAGSQFRAIHSHVRIHPTVSELLPTVLENLAAVA